MRHTLLQWIAASSLTVLVAVAAIRPHYGGVLRIEISEVIATPDTPGSPASSAEGLRSKIASQTIDGPFHVNRWNVNSVRLEANETYPAGRPFVDAVEIEMGKSRRDQLIDIEVGRTDLAEVEVTDIRPLKQKGIATQASKPLETVALIFDNRVPANTRQALALSIDRTAIQRVLLDHQGEMSGALLPQWLSGYAFLFPPQHDVAKAKNLAATSAPLSISYDPADITLRSIADRITVDAEQVGLKIHRGANGGDIRILRLTISSTDPLKALQDISATLNAPLSSSSPYEAERALLQDFKIVPLFHLPLVYAMGPNVRNWSVNWPLADVWLEAQHTP